MIHLGKFIILTILDKQDDLPADYKDGHKITLMDVVKSVSFGDMRFLTQVFILISILFWLTRAFAVLHHVVQYWDIKCFYNTALKISDSSLGKLLYSIVLPSPESLYSESVTWLEVQQKLVAAQAEHMMCIHKQELTALDVYHRILRYKNYMVAMVNKSLLPLRYTVPLLGDHAFLSTGLRFNLELLLFKSPWVIYTVHNIFVLLINLIFPALRVNFEIFEIS